MNYATMVFLCCGCWLRIPVDFETQDQLKALESHLERTLGATHLYTEDRKPS